MRRSPPFVVWIVPYSADASPISFPDLASKGLSAMRIFDTRGAGMRRLAGFAASTTFACVMALGATAAHATTVTGGSGLLSTFTTDLTKPGAGDPNNPGSPDLVGVSASATYDSKNIHLSATMAGAIGLTASKSSEGDQGIYIWGVNRGAGTAFLNDPKDPLSDSTTPIGGPDIKFDSFIVLTDLVNGHGDGFVANLEADGPHFIGLDATNISFSGNTIDLVMSLSNLPTHGFDISQYGFNIWPRYSEPGAPGAPPPGLGNNQFVASFLPGDHNFNASAVPEPAGWALMISGFGLVGTALRRRRLLQAA
jgi:hypothetical protein